MPPPESELPKQTADSIDAIRRLNERHEDSAAPIQKHVERLTRQFARPGTAIGFLALAVLWLVVNTALPRTAAPDPPPFDSLQVALGLASVTLTCLILTTQRRADVLAAHRAHLTLELALVAEQKTAKTIALIEELRRDLPMLANRTDTLADALAEPTDASAVIENLTGDNGRSDERSSKANGAA